VILSTPVAPVTDYTVSSPSPEVCLLPELCVTPRPQDLVTCLPLQMAEINPHDKD